MEAGVRENKRSPFAFSTSSKSICSVPKRAVSVKISTMLAGDTLCRCAKNGFSQGRTFSAIGGQTCEKMENSTPVTLNRK